MTLTPSDGRRGPATTFSPGIGPSADHPAQEPQFALVADPVRAVAAAVIGVVALAQFYTPGRLPLVLGVALITIGADRIIALVQEATRSARQNWQGRRSDTDYTPMPRREPAAGPTGSSGRAYGDESRRPPAPVTDQAPPTPALRPVAFVGVTENGAMPWRIPQISDYSGVAADQAKVGDLEVRAASVVGPAHRVLEHKATPRQDAYRLAPAARGKFLVVAVADGVSSARRSHLGANQATLYTVQRLKEVLDRCPDLSQLRADQVFPEVADHLQKLAERWQSDPADFATTLMVAVVPTLSRDPRGREVWLGWIADSSAWQFGQAWRPVAGQGKADFDSNAISSYMPMHPKRASHALRWLPHGESLALMTDGLSDLLTDVDGAAAELHRRWVAPPSLPELVRDMCFDAPGQDDDRTVVMVWTPERTRTAP